jgi:hypothetical protein
MAIAKHGITAGTPGNILLGAGTYYKGLKFETNAWSGTVLGATSGGGKISIKGEFIDLELDGALVKFKGQTVKQGGTATAEVNFAELTPDVIKMGTLFKEGTDSATGFTVLVDKANIADGDYIENFGFVGYTADGSKQIIVIFEYALCTSGMELEPKNKEQSVVKLTLEAVAANSGDLNTLPVKIYYPSASQTAGD